MTETEMPTIFSIIFQTFSPIEKICGGVAAIEAEMLEIFPMSLTIFISIERIRALIDANDALL